MLGEEPEEEEEPAEEAERKPKAMSLTPKATKKPKTRT
jgi:hypothetical protein